MARKSLKAGALTAPLPPVLATVGVGDEANIITIGWTGILSTHPARTYISVRPERHSHSLLRRHGEFVINLTTVKMAREVDYCGIYTGAKVNKFEKCGFTKTTSTEVEVPSIAESPLSIECRVIQVIPMGTHDVFIADIVGVSCDDSILSEDGRLCFDKAGLLAYAHGEYFALGEKVGKFGFSTKKAQDIKSARNKPAKEKPTSDKPAKDSSPKSKSDNGKPAKSKSPGNKSGVGASTGNKPKDNKYTSNRSARGGSPKDKTALEGSGSGSGGHRPFYSDAPRGKSKKGGKRK